MSTESLIVRLFSYLRWPGLASPCRLAQLGFRYSGRGDVVICCVCRVEIDSCRTVDQIVEEHRVRSPNCTGGVSVSRTDATPMNDVVVRDRPENESSTPGNIVDSGSYSESAERHRDHPSLSPTGWADAVASVAPDFDQLRSESVRLETFHNWPPRAARVVDPRDLAEAGLFYTGLRDRVQCAFCRGFLRNWIRGDRPADEHRKHFPDCPFVRGLDVGNVRRSDVVTNANREIVHYAEQNSEPAPVDAPLNFVETPSTSAQSRRRPKHPQFAEFQSRVASFGGKLVGQGQTVRGLATAGFFHVGPEDNVRCFQCDGGLKNWRPTDDPWTEHARWFPRCPFVMANKDQQFVDDAQFLARNLPVGLNQTFARSSSSERAVPAAQNDVTEREPQGNVLRSSSSSNNSNNSVSDPETSTMSEENRQLKEARTCKVCMDREVDTVFLPCGHLVCCSNCSPALRNCPICRMLIRGTVKIFLS